MKKKNIFTVIFMIFTFASFVPVCAAEEESDDYIAQLESENEELKSRVAELEEQLAAILEDETNDETEVESETEKMYYEIGDTVTTDYFEITLTSAKFTYGVNTDKDNENFLQPLNEDETEIEPQYILHGSDGYSMLYFSFDYKFTGKEAIAVPGLFNELGINVYYEDYTFDTSYFVAHKRDEENWHIFGTSYYSEQLDNFGGLGELAYYNSAEQYVPLENHIYKGIGIICVPTTVEEDINTPLLLKISDTYGYFQAEYKIR